MNDARVPAWDGERGTAGGAAFGAALQAFAGERDVDDLRLAAAAKLTPESMREVFEGERRLGVPELARLVHALRSKPIEFMQKTSLLSMEVYASGLDPLYFLPEGPIRYDARIYMREINPRHPVPEADMTKRNPILKAVAEDTVLDPQGKVEIELAYLLRAAAQQGGGVL